MNIVHSRIRNVNVGKKNTATVSLFKLLITVVLLFLLFRSISFDKMEFIEVFYSINITWFMFSLSGVVFVLVLKSLRWRELLYRNGINYNVKKTIMAYFSAYTIGVISPGRLGELVKVFNVRHDERSNIRPALIATISDRLFDLYFLCIFSIAGVLTLFSSYSFSGIVALILVTSILFVFLIVSGFIFDSLTNWRYFKNVFFAFIRDCLSTMRNKQSLASWFLTILAYTLFFLTTWFLFKAVNINISIIETGFVISIVGLVLLLPISIAGFGTRELSLVYLLSYYGVENETAILFSLLHFVSFFVWGGIVGLGFWIVNPISLSIIKEDSNKIASLFQKNKDSFTSIIL